MTKKLKAGVNLLTRRMYCAVFAALLALVVLIPVGAQAGQPVNQTYTCPGGSFLTGLQGRAGDWLDQFQPVCRSWIRPGADRKPTATLSAM